MSIFGRKLLPLPRTFVKIDDDSCNNSYNYHHCKSAQTPPPIDATKNHPHSSTSPLLVGVFCVLAFAFSVICFLTLSRRRRSYLRSSLRRNLSRINETHEEFIDEDRGPEVHHPIWLINYVGLEQSVIDSIDVVKYKKGEGLVEGTDCSVCLTEFEDDENLRLLPKCSHAFHLLCIDTWLRSHKNCPLCRAPILKEENNAHLGSNLNELSSSEETIPTPMENNELGDHNRHSEVENEEIGEKNSERISGLQVRSDLGDHNAKMGEELQPVRRSISMDPSSASLIYSAFLNTPILENEGSSSNSQLVQVEKPDVEKTEKGHNRASSSIYKRVMKSSSFGLSSQNVPMFMKRSYSSSGKSSSESSHRRSQGSVLPL